MVLNFGRSVMRVLDGERVAKSIATITLMYLLRTSLRMSRYMLSQQGPGHCMNQLGAGGIGGD